MAKPEQPVRTGNTVRLDTHAQATLSYIRASMEAAGSLALPGSVGISAGVIGVAAAALAALPALQPYWLIVWLAAAPVAAGVGSFLLVKQAARGRWSFAGAPLHRFALCLAPSLAAGAVMTALHWSQGNLHAIAGTWLMLYGCGLIAASVAAGSRLGFLGGAFFALGVLALLLPDNWQVAALGAGFGGFHLVFGVLTRRAAHDRES